METKRLKGLARVSIPILPEVLLQTYHNKKNKSAEGRGGFGVADGPQGKGKEKNRIPLSQRLDKLRNEKTNEFIAEITKTERTRPVALIPSKMSRRPSSSISNADRSGQPHRRLVAVSELSSPVKSKPGFNGNSNNNANGTEFIRFFIS